MKRRKNLWFQGAALLLSAITVVLAPGAGAQSKYKTLHRFKGGPKFVYAGLIFDGKGNFYGATAGGGTGRNGTVFELTPKADGSWTESVLYNFTGGTDGIVPYASLIFDQKGNLYGTTTLGGAGGSGTVFKLTPNADGSWSESVVYSFLGGEDGADPVASLIMDPAGNLYGTTTYGGGRGDCSAGECGVVFELMPNADGTWSESVLHRFKGFKNGKDGGNPEAGLIFDQAGNLYGTTQVGGGTGGNGTVFELTPKADGSWTESVPCRFNGRDGSNPVAGLIFDAAGNLYGTTPSGGAGMGVVFKLTPNSNGKWTETVLHRFFGLPGAFPFAGLIFDASGNLYGTTAGDTSTTFGSVFEITP